MGSSTAVLATFDWIAAQQFPAVAIELRSKATVSTTYTKPDYRPPERVFWEVNEYGIGVVLGPKLRGPIDLDVDAVDCLDMAPKLLPHTQAVFGRASKPASHWIYRVSVPELPSRRLVDPVTKTMIIELRADGGNQTVFPGSVHKDSGELIEWAYDGRGPPKITSYDPIVYDRAVSSFGLATILRRHFWVPSYRNLSSVYFAGFLFKLDWSLDEVLTIFDAAAGDDFDRKARNRVEHTFKRHSDGDNIAGSSKLRGEMKASPELMAALYGWAGNPDANVLEDYNERFACVRYGSGFRVADLTIREPVFMEKQAFVDFYATDYMPELDDQGKRVSKPRVWLANPARRRYDDVEFRPGAGIDIIEGQRRTLNLWPGWGVEPGAGCCDAWLELVWDVVCGQDEEAYWWILHWLAGIVREPCNKPMTALVLISDLEGAGKTLMFTYFGRILGSCYTPVTNARHITGNFNKHLAHTLLLHSEEALFAGNPGDASIARSLISDPFMMYEPKGVDATRTRNYMRVAFSTNQQYAVHPQLSDRRYTVINMSDRKLSNELRDRVKAEMEGDGPAALHKFLLEMQYDSNTPRTNIKNEALLGQKLIASNPIQGWWYQRLLEGVLLDQYLRCFSHPPDDDWPSEVAFQALFKMCQLHAQQSNLRRNFNEQQFKRELKPMLALDFPIPPPRRSYHNLIIDSDPATPQLYRNLPDKKLPSIIDLPPVEQCRAAFNKFIGHDMPWPTSNSDPPPRPPEAGDPRDVNF